MSEIDDRRQRAREAFYDEAVLAEGDDGHAIEGAIEVATQVRITREAIEASGLPRLTALAVLQAGLQKLGFEVIGVDDF